MCGSHMPTLPSGVFPAAYSGMTESGRDRGQTPARDSLRGDLMSANESNLHSPAQDARARSSPVSLAGGTLDTNQFVRIYGFG